MYSDIAYIIFSLHGEIAIIVGFFMPKIAHISFLKVMVVVAVSASKGTPLGTRLRISLVLSKILLKESPLKIYFESQIYQLGNLGLINLPFFNAVSLVNYKCFEPVTIVIFC